MQYRNYLLLVLTVMVVFNYVDRIALGVLLESIKIDLQLSDTQLGFLSGIAFAVFYAVMGVPIARWADRGNRVTIISVTAVLWSTAVALCATATTFMQLLLIRVGVAVGESGCIPPAFSLIADYFNRAERPRAAAIYGLGGPIACVVGFFMAGWLNQLYGWRATFVLMGAPGVILAGVAWFTLREPRRRESQQLAAETATGPVTDDSPRPSGQVAPSFRDVYATLWANSTFRHLLWSLAVNFFFAYGQLQWQPTFLIRSFGLETGAIGTWLALTSGVAGIIGSYVFGELASRYAAHNERLQLQLMAGAVAVAGVVGTLVYAAPTAYWAFAWMTLSNVGLAAINGPQFAAIQTLVPERMRAVAFALVYLIANLIGMGLGPLAVGALSDALQPLAGGESLRYALLVLGPGYLWSAWHLQQGSKTIHDDLSAAEIAGVAVVVQTVRSSAVFPQVVRAIKEPSEKDAAAQGAEAAKQRPHARVLRSRKR